MAEKPMVNIQGLNSYYGKGKERKQVLRNVSLTLDPGEVLGIVGESGSGKSTLAKCLLGVVKDTEGTLEVNAFRPQMVFQDPYGSLDPRMTVAEIVAEGLDIHHLAKNQQERRQRIYECLEMVGLNREHANRFVHEFSGGQRQRIGIARALAVNPEFIVLDEPISALDVSIQAQIVNLLIDLQKKMGLTYLFVAHDLSMVKHISDRIAVLYLGALVELAPAEELFANPKHPYTQALLSAIPVPDPDVEQERSKVRVHLEGELPSPINPAPGCKFCSRCRYATEACATEAPAMREVSEGHFVACCRCEK